MRDSMIFYRSFYEALQGLPLEQKGLIYDAIFNYGLNQELTELEGISKTVFTLIKPQLDANLKRFENGKKGGRKKEVENQKETKKEPKQNQTESKTKANNNNNVNNNLNVNNNTFTKSKQKALEFNLPDNFNSETFLNAWNEWKEYKSKEHKFKYKSPISEAKQLNQLVNDSEKNVNLAVEMINNAIVKGWKGIYKLDNKNVKNGAKQPITKKSRDEQYNEYINSLLQGDK